MREPSPLLELVRSERRLSELKVAPLVTTDPATVAESETEADDGTVRHIVVKTTRLATWESLARYALRHAEKQRPRELHETRFLLRSSGAVRGKTSTGKARLAIRTLLRDRRTDVKRCLVANEARRADVIIKAPSALVVEQALHRGRSKVEFDVRFEPGEEPLVSDSGDGLDGQARTCIGSALRTQDNDLPAMDLPVVAFTQLSHAYGDSPLNAGLASEAATLGWVHYEHGEFHDALAYFEDAYWIFHRVEYKVLVGMALESLDRPADAAEAYADYLAERHSATDTRELRAKVMRLRAATTRRGA